MPAPIIIGVQIYHFSVMPQNFVALFSFCFCLCAWGGGDEWVLASRSVR